MHCMCVGNTQKHCYEFYPATVVTNCSIVIRVMLHNAHTTKLSFYVTMTQGWFVLVCIICKLAVQVTHTRLCELRDVMPCVCYAMSRARVRACVCVKEIVTVLNLILIYIYNFYTWLIVYLLMHWMTGTSPIQISVYI